MNNLNSDLHIVIVDDETNTCRTLKMILENHGFRVTTFTESTKALPTFLSESVDLAIMDIEMPEIDGLSLFEKMNKENLDIPVIFISGNASLSKVAAAVKAGAFDFLEKPFGQEKLLLVVQRTLEFFKLKRRLQELGRSTTQNIVGDSPNFVKLLTDAKRVAPTTASVLIGGESGTGKELIANLIHYESPRVKSPFVRVNCSAIPESLIESEFFGHERGAFTGAIGRRIGYFEQAHGGTLFLDEIGDMSLGAQAKLLRAIQSKEIQRVGSTTSIPIDTRIICATHKDLKSEIAGGRFREDLYFRINVVPLIVPPLRERPEDISLLAQFFAKEISYRNGIVPKQFEVDALESLNQYSWPGNVRELQNLVERVVIMGHNPIQVIDLPEFLWTPQNPTANATPSGTSLHSYRNTQERTFIVNVLKEEKGNISKAAGRLQIQRTYLHRKIHEHKIEKREYF